MSKKLEVSNSRKFQTTELARQGPAKRDPFAFFNIHCCKTSKNRTVKKVSMRKKLKGVPFGIFQNPFCRKTEN